MTTTALGTTRVKPSVYFSATVPATSVAIARVRWQKGFVNGWDWPLSVLGGTIALLLLGSGAYSLDALLGLPW